jgi:phosphatidylglycerophosphate synthase
MSRGERGKNNSEGHNNAKSSVPASSNENKRSAWPVTLWIPNLMGYTRIFLAFCGYRCAMKAQPNEALNLWIISSLLDLFDGMVARRLNLCSKFGVLLDIIADNILRSVAWISAINELGKGTDTDASILLRCLWAAVVFLEWITMFCSQNKAMISQNNNWKDVDQVPAPCWVQAVFKNNFRTIPGILAIYGLFVAPLGSYILYADESWPKVLLSDRVILAVVIISYVGRSLSALVELWVCFDYAWCIIQTDKNSKVKVG